MKSNLCVGGNPLHFPTDPVRGAQIILSRAHPNFVRKLFELEVPEIYEGIVEIKSISRQAGERTKIAVASKNDKVDSVGACVGMRGNRVRNIVNEEFEKDPWYADCLEVAKLLGIKDINAVHRYIRKGWLKAERKPGGPHQGRYLVRRSDVEAFLATDQRPSSAETASRNMRGRLRRDGRPIKLSTRWIVRCSKCGHDVVVTAPPRMYGSAILKRMYEKYPSNGICAHGFRVVI